VSLGIREREVYSFTNFAVHFSVHLHTVNTSSL